MAEYSHSSHQRKRPWTDGQGEFPHRGPPSDMRGSRSISATRDTYPGPPTGPPGPRKGRGKGSLNTNEGGYVPTTEYRIPVDVNAFPPDVNIIIQLLGPRGKHQQRMKMESDAIVTTSGKGVRGHATPGEEPLTLVIRSKDPTIPLTPRQIGVVYQLYEDILHHVKE